MQYLITGITGFAGPHLAKALLEDGHEVHGLARCSNGREADLLDVLSPDELEAIRFRYADLTDYASVRDTVGKGYDGVFHLAAQSHPPTSFAHPVKTWADNVMGSVHLIDAVARLDHCRFLFCSTSEVYGRGPDFGEDAKLAPVNPYGASKAAIDLYVSERVASGVLDGVITRAFSHTGPRRGRRFSISSDAFHLARMTRGEGRVLPVGNLETQRVVIDVRDAVRAYALVMETGAAGGVYNVAGDTVRAMSFFTDALIEISGLADIEKRVDPDLWRPVDIALQNGPSDRVRALGWRPEIPIERTLRDLYDYWTVKLWGSATS